MWVKIDDGFYDNGKVIAVGKDARALYLAALCFANKNGTRGFIPEYMISQLAAKAEADKPQQAVERLCKVFAPNRSSLWARAEGGYEIHDYHDYQLTPERVVEISEVRSEAGSKGGKKSAEARAAAKQAQATEQADFGDMPARNDTSGGSDPSPSEHEANREAKQREDLQANQAKVQANGEPNACENPSKLEANSQQKVNPVSRIPDSDSRLPNPAAAAPPTSPPPEPVTQPPEQSAAAAVSLRFSGLGTSGQNGSGQVSSDMSAMRSVLPALSLPEPPEANLKDSLKNSPPLLVLSSEEADRRILSRALQDCGVSRYDSDLLVSEALHPGNAFSLGDIRDQVAWLPYQNATHPGYWLPRYIREGRAKPKALVAAEQEAKRRQVTAEKQRGVQPLTFAEQKEQQGAKDAARQAYCAALPATELAALEAGAEASFLEIPTWKQCLLTHGKDSGAWKINFKLHLNKIIDERLSG